ncbi:hypothetical protein EYZ11_003496 [Aspergillus tanneri]|uniref:Beta-lactamase-related domain-containing protein n=1 Tax=Aspergillus tanneri TaxID=1220188 RepID=A0A4S3JN91_9EURO|nr:uncharacterized protein ATNIH1004_007031 [Aspergillus tanneri]KAA8645612.1 hypothetical protein ATNIH1004_007031 [Aspergillus tanneri]THC97053.1 hypothetical protein EYZ11_003496 [Aspergillus tanneri]
MVLRSANSPFTPEFDRLVQEQLEKWKVPGITIAVVHRSSTYSKAYGIAEFPTKKMTTDSLFSTCSTTKAFTAAAVSLAIDERKSSSSPINWDTPISSLIRDDFILADDHTTCNTTIEDALSHRSGLPTHVYATLLANPNETLRHAVRNLRHLPLACAPRTTFAYSNQMYMAISHVLEQINGESLGTTLQKQIWTPLAMHDTYFDVQAVSRDPSTAPRLVRGYTWAPEAEQYVSEPYLDYAAMTGASAMVSTVLDYTKWLRAMIYRTGPISTEGHAALLHPRSIISNTDDIVAPKAPYHLYALGWFIDQIDGEQLYWHSGSWPGFGIMVGFIPDKQWGFAMMGNATSARNVAQELYLYLIDQLGVNHTPKDGERVTIKQETTQKNTGLDRSDDTKKKLYPCLPDPPIPHSLPLHQYAGIYSHPAYGPIPLVLDEQLSADLSDRAEKLRLALQHASGEFFIGFLYSPGNGSASREGFRVEFVIDSTGTAQKIGIELEPALREKIWFERID